MDDVTDDISTDEIVDNDNTKIDLRNDLTVVMGDLHQGEDLVTDDQVTRQESMPFESTQEDSHDETTLDAASDDHTRKHISIIIGGASHNVTLNKITRKSPADVKIQLGEDLLNLTHQGMIMILDLPTI